MQLLQLKKLMSYTEWIARFGEHVVEACSHSGGLDRVSLTSFSPLQPWKRLL